MAGLVRPVGASVARQSTPQSSMLMRGNGPSFRAVPPPASAYERLDRARRHSMLLLPGLVTSATTTGLLAGLLTPGPLYAKVLAGIAGGLFPTWGVSEVLGRVVDANELQAKADVRTEEAQAYERYRRAHPPVRPSRPRRVDLDGYDY